MREAPDWSDHLPDTENPGASELHARILQRIHELAQALVIHADELFASVSVDSVFTAGSSSAGGGVMSKVMQLADFLMLPKEKKQAMVLDQVLRYAVPQLEVMVNAKTEEELRQLIQKLQFGLEDMLNAETAHG